MTIKKSGPWLKTVILRDYNDQNPEKLRSTLAWSDVNMKPVWWPDHLWKWEETCQWTKISRAKFTGQGRAVDCYKNIIAHYPETQFGVKAESYTSSDFDLSKKKMHGRENFILF